MLSFSAIVYASLTTNLSANVQDVNTSCEFVSVVAFYFFVFNSEIYISDHYILSTS